MEQNQISVDEREYQEWLVRNNLENPMPSTTSNTVPEYEPRTVNPDELNQSGRDTGTALTSIAPDILKALGIGYGVKKIGEGLLGRGAPGPAGPMGAPGPAGPMGAPGPQGASGLPFSQTPQGTLETLKAPSEQLNQPRGQSVARATPTSEPYGRTFTPSRSTNPAIPGSQGMPSAPSAQPAGRMANIGGRVAQSLFAPEALFAAPYAMAAYEQEKIRQNPNAPEYATTPYAQMYRGEYATQGAAGAANRRDALANQRFGGLTQQEQDILEQDRINRAIRRKAAEKVLGPIAPRGM